MMAALLVAGIGLVVAGLLSIGFGIPVKEFSFGNTLILTGALGACTGAILLGLWVVVRELKTIAGRLGPRLRTDAAAETLDPAGGSIAASGQEPGGFPFSRDQPTAATPGAPAAVSSTASPPPWQEGASSRDVAPAPVEPAVKARRNLLFSSSSRKERERTQARGADPSAADVPGPPATPPAVESSPPSPATFDDAWPQSERARSASLPPRRSSRTPSTFTEATPGAASADQAAPAARSEEPPPVTVLKSGVVDGMAYSLYSDGSIEAQMPEGMMRFASIDELRAHLDQRP